VIIADPIYGQFSMPDPIRGLCLTPEVRRLSQIRLLNTLTPSLATLGELRRFSHTLGVLYLASQNQFFGNKSEREAFAAAVLLHDIGTPPFGHLFEYHLQERFSWNHETVIRHILTGTHVPENRAHQIFANQTVAFRSLLTKSSIDLALVEKIISGEHHLSQLLFGTLDFDNLDNVARMNWALGQLDSSSSILDIARNLGIGHAGNLTLSEEYKADVTEWLRLRKSAYEVIVFDPPTVAAQAVLSSALETALESGALQSEDWTLTDEKLLDLLLKEKQTKKAIATQYLGHLPEQAFALQVNASLESLGFQTRREVSDLLNQELARSIGPTSLGYIFIDKGTFTKKITLTDPDSGSAWSVGERSQSVIFHAFTRSSHAATHRKCLHAVQSLLEALKLNASSISKCMIGPNSEITNAQQTLKITA
jgi:HD superfamily phosphohydrolase